LIETAYARKDDNWLISSLFAMGRSSDERWKKQVIAQLRNPKEDVRSEAIHATGELEMGSARLPLLDMLEDEEDSELRREIIWALSEIGGEGVRSKIEELLDGETDDEDAGFLEEALDNLLFTEELNQFEMFDFESDDEDEDLEEE
jgi:HEAT repeat protein